MRHPTTPASDGKASFDDLYDQPDPRAYMRVLSQLDYQVPEHARGVFARLIEVLGAERDEPLCLVDLCTSYGVIPTLLNHDVTLADLYERYSAPELDDVGSDALAELDRRYYAPRRRAGAVRAVGLDTAANAVAYAERAGVLDVGVAENLERDQPSATLRRALADADLVTVTGGLSYIGEATFERVLGAIDGPAPWVAAFGLRAADTDPIARLLEQHGLLWQRLEGRTFRQRRFVDDTERTATLHQLQARGIDPEGVETDGYYHTWLYLARPRDVAEQTSPAELLQPVWSSRQPGVRRAGGRRGP